MIALVMAAIFGAVFGSVTGHAAQGAAIAAGAVAVAWLLPVAEYLLQLIEETWVVWLGLYLVYAATR